ncbi:MAG: NPCBM/NEW2 domain-containing protein [Phycisphaerae bacterium]
MKLRHLVALALISALYPAWANAAWTLTDADLKTQTIPTIGQWSLKDGLTYADTKGAAGQLATRNIVRLVNGDIKVNTNKGWRVHLRNGDVIMGLPGAISEKSLTITATDLGNLQVALKDVVCINRGVRPATITATKDTVILKNGDQVAGLLLDVGAEKLQIQSDIGPVDLTWEKVERIEFSASQSPRKLPELATRLGFSNGTIFTTATLSWKDDVVTFQDTNGKACQTPIGTVVSVDVLGGRVVWLAELEASEDQQTSLLGTPWPTQINRNVMGQPLRVKGENFTRGLGVHVTSQLLYKLDGTFKTLALRVGVDDSAKPHGESHVKIVLDGKTLWEKADLKAGELTPLLQLDITGGKNLELNALPHTQLDVQGRVNWIEPALLRP